MDKIKKNICLKETGFAESKLALLLKSLNLYWHETYTNTWWYFWFSHINQGLFDYDIWNSTTLYHLFWWS